MRIRPVWSEWQGGVILGEKTKILCLQVPIKYTCIVCLFWYSIPLKLPLLKMSFRIEKYRLLHRKGYLFAPGPRGFQWNISVLMTAVFSRKILLSLAQSNINACFKFKERKCNFIYWIGDFKSCMYIVFEMGWFKDPSKELWGWKFGPKL